MVPIFSVLSLVTTALDKLGIRYVLVGSFASSIHGLYRATADIDIVAEIKGEQVHPLYEALREAFYVDEFEMRSRKSARLTRSTSIRFSKLTSSSHNKMTSQSRNSTTGSYENSHPIATSRYMSHPPKILFLRSCAGTAREMNHQRTSGMMYWEFLGSCETVWPCVICGCGRGGCG